MADNDEMFMRAALAEAHRAGDEGEIPIGAVVVCGGRIVGRGHNMVESLCDATAHAEMQALTAAMNTLGGKYLSSCTLYVTVEPCTMCASASMWAQVGRIVYGAGDNRRGYSRLSDNILHPRTVIVKGVLEEECAALMTAFFEKLR